jgi:hypothetical protein
MNYWIMPTPLSPIVTTMGMYSAPYRNSVSAAGSLSCPLKKSTNINLENDLKFEMN